MPYPGVRVRVQSNRPSSPPLSSLPIGHIKEQGLLFLVGKCFGRGYRSRVHARLSLCHSKGSLYRLLFLVPHDGILVKRKEFEMQVVVNSRTYKLEGRDAMTRIVMFRTFPKWLVNSPTLLVLFGFITINVNCLCSTFHTSQLTLRSFLLCSGGDRHS